MPFYFLLSALWVAVDQVVKYLVRTYIPLYASVPFLPGMDLTYVQNTGAAFSLLSEHTWVLTLLSAVVSVGLVVAMAKRILPHWSGMLSLALLLAPWATSSTGRCLALSPTCLRPPSSTSPSSTWQTSAWWWGASSCAST